MHTQGIFGLMFSIFSIVLELTIFVVGAQNIVDAEQLARPCTGTWKLLKSSWPSLPTTQFDLFIQIKPYQELPPTFAVAATLENTIVALTKPSTNQCSAQLHDTRLISLPGVSSSNAAVAAAETEIKNMLLTAYHWKLYWNFETQGIMLKLRSLWYDEIDFFFVN
eukprot:Gregarina_sp_Poly_1__3007@NODE_1845_length_3223_cov_38_906210_g1198_i0_p3_GENE_NODE_1845_length_3223_cov_38_906210_g1198_i0NODE_1845_length_3223_cov_38_906210_g1198_i0_p3_ORF_typecomplete_len165_score19_07_NODE_1845_length_3223_cov_38_906210_g1198_i0420914